jgi:hypothetical protein
MMKKEEIERYEELLSKLVSIKNDIAQLSSKKPSDQLNKFKIKYINDVLAKVNSLIGKDKPYDDFDIFDEVALPTNSDALMIINLYLNGMHRFKIHNSSDQSIDIDWAHKERVWNIEDDEKDE